MQILNASFSKIASQVDFGTVGTPPADIWNSRYASGRRLKHSMPIAADIWNSRYASS